MVTTIVKPLSMHKSATACEILSIQWCCLAVAQPSLLQSVVLVNISDPHLQALRQAGMRDRHWEQLSQQLNVPLKPDKDFVLSKAMDLHLMDHLDTIQKVSAVLYWVACNMQCSSLSAGLACDIIACAQRL